MVSEFSEVISLELGQLMKWSRDDDEAYSSPQLKRPSISEHGGVVGLFDYVEDHTPDGIKVRVYCQVGKENQGKFALDVAVKTLGLYKDYFETPYSLPKLDMIAIPDFAAGAMENYGLVTYRETALLYDDKHSAAANRGCLAADGLFQEWKIWTQFLDESTEGLRLDGLSESHPIEVEINHAGEIDEIFDAIFDAISYRKGASVIRMLQIYLGAKVFQRAVAKYIKKHAFSNAKTEDLWAALEEESKEPVTKLMDSWTKQKGYHVVSVKLKDSKFEFEQVQFLSSGCQGGGQWVVPITLCCGSYEARKSFLLETKSKTIDTSSLFGRSISDNEPSSSWIKVNIDRVGFYRVKYDEQLSAKLRYAIESKSLSAMDRYGILDDSFALSMAGQLPLSSLLTLISKVARIVADADNTLLDNIKTFFINLFQYSAERIGFDPKKGESHLDALLIGELFATLAVFGHEDTLLEANKHFQAFLEDINTHLLPPDIRRAVYVAVMKKVTATNRSGFDSLLKVIRETDLSQEKTRILGALGSCSDPDIILEVLNFLLTPEVRSQDVVFGLAVSREGREVAWNWFKENWEHISSTWGRGFLITRFVSALVSPFSSNEKVKEVEEFFVSRAKPFNRKDVKTEY
ncbi:hypothetical protein L2E82_03582 [Cichorium intybus]|uniref:Uncharacterized protein n=1 Tax=Cichorium intybus TaxID=13427 RepID=A0ACB9H5F1_CICIN|nr:hypothetical protein L2E82_03582 [Cichorium intybus]